MTPYSRKYTLKNGTSLTVRQPVESDAEALVALMRQVDTETRFLAREPGEFGATPELERDMIWDMLDSDTGRWFIAEYDGEIVGQCGVSVKSRRRRFCHRGEVGILVRADSWGLGIGGRMMSEAIEWCRDKGLEQLELEVVAGNDRALAMYESFGFRITGTRPDALKYADGTYADEYIMTLKL